MIIALRLDILDSVTYLSVAIRSIYDLDVILRLVVLEQIQDVLVNMPRC